MWLGFCTSGQRSNKKQQAGSTILFFFNQRICHLSGVVYPLAFGPVAQWLEHPAHNGVVLGSSPSGSTRF